MVETHASKRHNVGELRPLFAFIPSGFFVRIRIAILIFGIFLDQIGQVCPAHHPVSLAGHYKNARAFWEPQNLLSQDDFSFAWQISM